MSARPITLKVRCRFCERALARSQVEAHVARAHVGEAVRAWATEWRFKGDDFDAWCAAQWVRQ